MKTMMSLILLLGSLNCFAELVYKWPSVQGLAVNNACATPTTFRSIHKIEVCLETAVVSREACQETGAAEFCRPLGLNEKPTSGETVHEHLGCVKKEMRDLEVSRLVTVRKCVQWAPGTPQNEIPECLKFETTTQTIGQNFKVEVVDESPESGPNTIQTIDFKVPDCAR